MNDYEREAYRAAGESRVSKIKTLLIVLIVLLGGLVLGLSGALLYLHLRESPSAQNDAALQLQAETPAEAAGESGEPGLEAAPQEPVPQDFDAAGTPTAETGIPEEASEEELRSAYEAYLELLERERPSIDRYYWQRGYYGWGELNQENLARPVVFADLNGDGIPELLYLTEEQPDMVAGLRIVTWEKGELRTLFSESWDYLVAGGVRYYFFQLKDSKELWVHRSSGDEFWTWSYGRFEETGDRTLERRVLLRKDREVEYSGSEYKELYKYAVDGQEATEQAYADALRDLEGKTETVLMFSSGCGDFAEGFAAREGCPAMTCEEAIAWLRLQLTP